MLGIQTLHDLSRLNYHKPQCTKYLGPSRILIAPNHPPSRARSPAGSTRTVPAEAVGSLRRSRRRHFRGFEGFSELWGVGGLGFRFFGDSRFRDLGFRV